MSWESLRCLPKGAEWVRVDLHLHGPGSPGFRTAGDPRGMVPAYVEALRRAGVRLCALAGHHRLDRTWFEALRQRARREGIAVLPALELILDQGGKPLQLVVVLEEGEDLEALEVRLRALCRGRPLVDEGGRPLRMEPAGGVRGLLEELRGRFECLVLAPHPDGPGGLLRNLGLKVTGSLLREGWIDALEEVPGEVARALAEEVGRPVALLATSHPRCVEEVGGGRPAFLKLSHLGLEAVRLALHEPQLRVRLDAPPRPGHPRLLGFEAEGAHFLEGVAIRFHEGLNVLIGGRGAGKSAILETIRYALDLPPLEEPERRRELVHHALGSGGKAVVYLERPVGDGAPIRYRVERTWGEPPRVWQLGEGTALPLEVHPREVLGEGEPQCFGQQEIYAVSGQERFLLRVVDALLGEELKRLERQESELLRRLEENARHILRLRERLGRRDELEARLRALEHELRIYEQHRVLEKLGRERALRRERHALQELSRGLEELAARLSRWREEAGARLRLDLPEEPLAETSGLFGRLQGELAGAERALREGFEQMERALQRVRRTLEEVAPRWEDVRRELAEELSRVKRELRTDRLDPDRVLQLDEERARLRPRLTELEEVRRRLEAARRERRELLERLRAYRAERHRRRAEGVERLNRRLSPRLRLELVERGQREGFVAELEAMLRGSRVSRESIEQLAAEGDGLRLADLIRQGPSALTDALHLTPAMAERTCRWLAEDEAKLMRLETMACPDRVVIRMRLGTEERPLERLSVGQRCTCLLLLLLEERRGPLIVDQPEDELDNRFVYQDVVGMLRMQREERQVIFATHNANIPVLGDAELILALEATPERCRVARRGAIDDPGVREAVKEIMEGGEEAFRLRKEKYGI